MYIAIILTVGIKCDAWRMKLFYLVYLELKKDQPALPTYSNNIYTSLSCAENIPFTYSISQRIIYIPSIRVSLQNSPINCVTITLFTLQYNLLHDNKTAGMKCAKVLNVTSAMLIVNNTSVYFSKGFTPIISIELLLRSIPCTHWILSCCFFL